MAQYFRSFDKKIISKKCDHECQKKVENCIFTSPFKLKLMFPRYVNQVFHDREKSLSGSLLVMMFTGINNKHKSIKMSDVSRIKSSRVAFKYPQQSFKVLLQKEDLWLSCPLIIVKLYCKNFFMVKLYRGTFFYPSPLIQAEYSYDQKSLLL